MQKQSIAINKQSGVVLLEGLIAILIFSLGVLAIVGMQAMAVKQVTDAQYRSEAGMLVNELLGTMWVSNRQPSVLQNNFNTGRPGYEAWKARVASVLPGVAANPPSVDVSAVGVVTVTIRWRAPNEPASATAHSHVAIAQIR